MMSSWPAAIGISTSPFVLPVRISGPFYTRSALGLYADLLEHTVSRAMARGLPVMAFSAALALSITLWWYYNHLNCQYPNNSVCVISPTLYLTS